MECHQYEYWYDSKNKLPALGEVIEGIGPKNWLYNNLGRDYFALVEINSKLTWITPSFSEMDYGELKITHWRHIVPNPKGKKPYVKIKMYCGFWEPRIYFA